MLALVSTNSPIDSSSVNMLTPLPRVNTTAQSVTGMQPMVYTAQEAWQQHTGRKSRFQISITGVTIAVHVMMMWSTKL